MKRKYNPYTLPPWLKKTRAVCQQFVLPIGVFQAIRTFIMPTTFDILLLAIIILLAVGFYFEMI